MNKKRVLVCLILLGMISILKAQDSVTVRIRPKYDSVSGLHRTIFGENYRKEWAAKVKLPYLKISQLDRQCTSGDGGTQL